MKICPISANFGAKLKKFEILKFYPRLVGKMVKKTSPATVTLINTLVLPDPKFKIL